VNQATRQRVVGILVLGCLAIILISLLLDGEGMVTPPLATTIPAAPTFNNTPIAEPTRPVIEADSKGEPLMNTDVTVVEASDPSQVPDATSTKPGPSLALPAVVIDEPAATNASAVNAEAPDALEAAVAAIMAKDKVAANKAATVDADAVPHKDSKGLPESYAVRLGSFGDKANADNLLKKLLGAKYKAFTRMVSTANAQMHAVYVGPLLTRAEAKTMATKLDSTFNVQSSVETFTAPPLQPRLQ
jgi:DedD protein